MNSLLSRIRQHPSMFYGGPETIDRFQNFFMGILVAEEYHDIKGNQSLFEFDWNEFEEWLANKFTRLSGKSFVLAKVKCNNDGKEALKLWFQWYDEFQEKHHGKKSKAAHPRTTPKTL